MVEQESVRVFTGEDIKEALHRTGIKLRKAEIKRKRNHIVRTEEVGLSAKARFFMITL